MSSPATEPIVKLSDKRGLSLLEETLEEIEAHEFRTWDQSSWIDRVSLRIDEMPELVVKNRVPTVDCGTTACLFGHLAFKAGGRMVEAPAAEDYSLRFSDYQIETADGDRRDIETYGQELLGLPYHMAEWLSNPERSWTDLLEFRDAWRLDAADGEGVTYHREKLVLVYDDEAW